MEKSKLGISLNLFSAILYFLGALSNIIIITIAAAYVLICEENEKLKRTAIKALLITIALSIVTYLMINLLSLSAHIFNVIQNFRLIDNSSFNTNFYFSNLVQYIQMSANQILSIIQILIPVVLGFRAYRQKDIKIKWIDNILDKHLSEK